MCTELLALIYIVKPKQYNTVQKSESCEARDSQTHLHMW